MAHSLHSSSSKPGIHPSTVVGKLIPFPNFCKDRDKKVRFNEGEQMGSAAAGATVKQQQQQQQHQGVMPKHKQADELPPFGEHRVQQQQQQAPKQRDPVGATTSVPYSQEYRLKGKLKWLFEQDRMFWESNSAKSSRRGSPEVDLSKGSRAMSTGKSSDEKLLLAVEEGLKMQISTKPPLGNYLKKPRQHNNSNNNNNNSNNNSNNSSTWKVSREDSSTADDLSKLPSGKMYWTTSNISAKVWPHENTSSYPSTVSTVDSSRGSSRRYAVPDGPQRSPANRNRLEETTESGNIMSSLDLGGEEFFTDDDDDAPNSRDSSEPITTDVEGEEEEDDGETRTSMDTVAVSGGENVKDLKNEAAFLKDKCDILYQERDFVVQKWKESCLEMDQAAKMAQALRTAIETLLEASAGDSRADFRTRQDILDCQTQALRMRMAKLGRKNPEGDIRRSEEKGSSRSLEDRIETLKKHSEGPKLASPEIPRDTEHKVEALRARLEKLMLATNSRATDEEGQAQRRARDTKKQAEDFFDLNAHRHREKGELKMKGWFNSLSAEWTMQELPGTSAGGCEKCGGTHGRLLLRDMESVDTPLVSKQATPITSEEATPFTSKQVSPMHERDNDGPGSARSSEETKKKVIHKIAEEVRLEAEQWFQVQELLQRVGEDMKRLQEACSTWEKRAVLAEAQVACMHQEGQESKQKALPVGDNKIADLQKEMLRLRETVEEVRKQLGTNNIDPSRWFEAANNFGYAFMPVNLHLSCDHAGTHCGCKGKCNISTSPKCIPESSDQWRQSGTKATGIMQPSSSISSPASPLTIADGETALALSDSRRRSQLPSQQWANEIARAEEEILTSSTTGQSSRLTSANITIKEMVPASGGKLQEKAAKSFHKEHGMETSGSRGDLHHQMQSSSWERGSILHQEEQLARYSSFNSALRRSPLKDVLENIASSKENKRPF